MHRLSLTNLYRLDSERKSNPGRTTRHHRRSGENRFYNPRSRSLLDDRPPPVVSQLYVPELIEPDLDTPTGSQSPERDLMLAVLEDAIYCYQYYEFSTSNRRLWRETDLWFRSSEAAWPYSFINICHALGMDPDYVRAGVFAMRRAA